MTTKETVIRSIQHLPDSATWAEIEEHVRFLAALEKGHDDMTNGRIVPHDEVKARIESCLSQ